MLRKIALGGLLSIFATFFVIEVPWSASGWLGVIAAQASSNPKSVDSAPARTRGASGSEDVTGRWSGQIHDTQDGDGDFSRQSRDEITRSSCTETGAAPLERSVQEGICWENSAKAIPCYCS